MEVKEAAPAYASTWWYRLLTRIGIHYEEVDVVPRRRQAVLNVFDQERTKLETKLERLIDTVHNQLVDWAINDETRKSYDSDLPVRGTVSSSVVNVVSNSEGSTGFSTTSLGNSIVRRHRGQR